MRQGDRFFFYAIDTKHQVLEDYCIWRILWNVCHVNWICVRDEIKMWIWIRKHFKSSHCRDRDAVYHKNCLLCLWRTYSNIWHLWAKCPNWKAFSVVLVECCWFYQLFILDVLGHLIHLQTIMYIVCATYMHVIYSLYTIASIDRVEWKFKALRNFTCWNQRHGQSEWMYTYKTINNML